MLKEHECENDEKDLADIAVESVEKSNANYETITEYMKTYADQDADMPNALDDDDDKFTYVDVQLQKPSTILCDTAEKKVINARF